MAATAVSVRVQLRCVHQRQVHEGAVELDEKDTLRELDQKTAGVRLRDWGEATCGCNIRKSFLYVNRGRLLKDTGPLSALGVRHQDVILMIPVRDQPLSLVSTAVVRKSNAGDEAQVQMLAANVASAFGLNLADTGKDKKGQEKDLEDLKTLLGHAGEDSNISCSDLMLECAQSLADIQRDIMALVQTTKVGKDGLSQFCPRDINSGKEVLGGVQKNIVLLSVLGGVLTRLTNTPGAHRFAAEGASLYTMVMPPLIPAPPGTAQHSFAFFGDSIPRTLVPANGIVHQLKLHDHIFLSHEHAQLLLDFIVDYTVTTLTRGSAFLLNVYSLFLRDQLLQALSDRGIDTTALLQSGRCRMFAHKEAYAQGVPPTVESLMDFAMQMLSEGGCQDVCVLSEPRVLVPPVATPDFGRGVLAVERQWGGVCLKEPIILVCVYDRRAYPADVLRDSQALHRISAIS
eukprot:TRINITY_DN1805_c0_g2_i6.p1 TRINITY_DN1805_c0_g2~~TRINITY_DN1805_c0_g2_i6.p1  ORF type:complete len:458 (-),score=70.98 TRINITY_DN1805_c0_g2_i6:16-1389(-)